MVAVSSSASQPTGGAHAAKQNRALTTIGGGEDSGFDKGKELVDRERAVFVAIAAPFEGSGDSPTQRAATLAINEDFTDFIWLRRSPPTSPHCRRRRRPPRRRPTIGSAPGRAGRFDRDEARRRRRGAPIKTADKRSGVATVDNDDHRTRRRFTDQRIDLVVQDERVNGWRAWIEAGEHKRFISTIRFVARTIIDLSAMTSVGEDDDAIRRRRSNQTPETLEDCFFRRRGAEQVSIRSKPFAAKLARRSRASIAAPGKSGMNGAS